MSKQVVNGLERPEHIDKFERVRLELCKAKRYWNMFCIGDKVAIKYYHIGRAKSKYVSTTGTIRNKNNYYMDVFTCDAYVKEIRLSDLILEKNRTMIKHI